MSKESQGVYFHQKEFFVERKLNEKEELILVSQKRQVDFDQFADAIKLDEYPKFEEPVKNISDNVAIIPLWENSKTKSKNKNPKSRRRYVAKGHFCD